MLTYGGCTLKKVPSSLPVRLTTARSQTIVTPELNVNGHQSQSDDHQIVEEIVNTQSNLSQRISKVNFAKIYQKVVLTKIGH